MRAPAANGRPSSQVRRRAAWTVLVPLVAAAANPVSVSAQSTIERLRTLETTTPSAEADIRAIARALDEELIAMKRRLVEAATVTQRQEQVLVDIEDSLVELEAEAGLNRRSLGATQDRISDLAVALQRISRRPPEAMIAGDLPPLDVVRATLILETLIRDMDRQSANLRDRLATAERIAADIREGRERLMRATEALNADRATLSAMIEEKRELNRRRVQDGTKPLETLRTLAASARSVRELMSGLALREDNARQERQALIGLMEPPSASAPAKAPTSTIEETTPEPGPAVAGPVRKNPQHRRRPTRRLTWWRKPNRSQSRRLPQNRSSPLRRHLRQPRRPHRHPHRAHRLSPPRRSKPGHWQGNHQPWNPKSYRPSRQDL